MSTQPFPGLLRWFGGNRSIYGNRTCDGYHFKLYLSIGSTWLTGLVESDCANTGHCHGRGHSKLIQRTLPELEIVGSGLTSEIKASSLLVFKAFRKSE